jgi:biopolymer transport protein ExbB
LSSFLFSLALLQIPTEGVDMTFRDIWEGGGGMMWFLGAAFLVGMIVIVIKLVDLTTKGARTKRVLREVDGLVAEGRIPEAIEAAERSNTPAGRILSEGLRRHAEGTERVVKAIENAGMIEMAKQAFQAIEVAGEVEATLVAGGIKVALITTASGLAIAIPVSIAHNFFVSRIDRLVIDMEESAQRTIDALHEIEAGRSPAAVR